MREQSDYGIDAPGVRRAMLGVGVGGALLSGVAIVLAVGASGPASTAATGIAGAASLAAVYGLSMASYIT